MQRRGGPQRFSDEFRPEAVRLAQDPNRSLKGVAAESGVCVTTLRNWMRSVPLAKQSAPGRVLTLEEQVRRLQKENAQLREEREISKKATAFFAKGAR